MSLLEITRALNKAERMVVRPSPNRVKRVNYAVTYLCDSRCVMCDIWKRYRVDRAGLDDELGAADVQAVFTASSAFGALDEVSLTGGEPFIKRDFVEIYGFFRRQYPRATLVITTNGFNTPLMAKKLGEVLGLGGAPPILVFSLDGGPELHQQVRGIGDGFEKVRRSIEAARSLHMGLRIVLSYTILPFNYGDLEAVYGLSVDLGASFTMRFGTKSDIYYGNADWACTWAPGQLEEVHGAIGRIVKDMLGRRNLLMRALNPDTYFYSRMTDYQRDPRRIFECFSGTHSFFMDPWGNVFPCITLPHALGNVRETPFDEFWFSNEAREARAAIARWECHCWTECEAIPSLQRTFRRPATDRGGGAPASVRTAADR